MNDDNNNVEQQEPNQVGQQPKVSKSYNPANISNAKKIGEKIYKGTRTAVKALKSAIKTIGKVTAKAISVILSNPILLAAIAIFFFIVIVILIIMNLISSDAVNSSVSSGATSVIDSWDESNLTEQQSLAKTSYETTGSLLDFTVSDIESMISQLKEKNDSLTSSSEEKSIYNQMLEEMGSNSIDTSNRIVSPDDNVSLYEHMLLISKYDFNNVKWKRYGHGVDGEDSPMQEDLELGVKYPSDTDGTTYETFSSLLKPYLLSYEIPTAFFAGLLSDELDNTNEMVYAIIKYGLSDITVNRYDMQKYTEETYYLDYDYTPYHSSFYATITTDENGAVFVSVSSITEVQEEETQHYNSRTNDAGEVDVTMETRVYDKTDITNKYYVSKAYIFDYKYENEYKYVKYSEDDTNNRVNYDTEVPVESPYNPIENEDNIITAVYGVSYSADTNTTVEDAIANIESKYGVTLEKTQDGKYYFKGGTYTRIEGVQVNITRTWSDTLSQSSSTSGFYTTDDVITYNESCSAGVVSSDDFNSDTTSVEYYDKLESNEKLNRIDFLNSNPNIYLTYVNAEKAYAEYVGIYRQELEAFCYENLKDNWNALLDDDDIFPYQYGKTLGFQGKSSGSSTSSLSGMDLLKKYLRSREGHEGLADENGNKLSGDDWDNAVYYIVGSVYGNRTVGYGIDLDASSYESEIKAAMGVTENFKEGDLIPIEIVDKCEEEEIEKAIAAIEAEFEGIELKEYQIHALVSRYYNEGSSGWKWSKYSKSSKTIVESYNAYWNEEEDDQYETLYEEYKDNQENKSEIIANVDYDNKFYTDIMAWVDNGGVLTTRRQSEWILFSLGYYDTLKVFWSSGGATPGGINLYNSDKTVNEEACAELTNWYVDNFFSGSSAYKFSSGYGGSIRAYDHSVINSSEYSFLANGLGEFQCTWWARARATYYTWQNDSSREGINLYTHGNGKDVARETAEYYGLTPNTDVTLIKENSIVSLTSSSDYGHVAYVEAVDYENECYYTSECGRGDDPYGWWYGIKKRYFSDGKFIASVSIDDIMNTTKYQEGK